MIGNMKLLEMMDMSFDIALVIKELFHQAYFAVSRRKV